MASLLAVAFLIIIFDALVSAAEAAIYSVPVHRARFLAEQGRMGKSLLALKESMERPITTLTALSNLITIAGSIIVGLMADSRFNSGWVGFIAGILTFLVTIFGEIIPKRMGERYAEPVALFSAPVIQIISGVFSPVSWLTGYLTKPFLSERHQTTSEEEIAFLANVAEKEGTIERGESQMIQRIFRFNDITATDIMTPRQFVDFIDGAKTVGELADFIKTAKHSRFPVYEGDKNNIIGIVHQRNLLKALAEGELVQPVKNYAWEAMVVPESRLADDLLRDMRDKRAQLAVVVSDYGDILGVAGIEDVLEELVGEIIDEKDVAPEFIKRIGKNEILTHGQTQLSYINHFFNTDIKSRRKNLNGFLLEQFGELPKDGAVREYKGLKFFVEAVGPRSIDRVRIVKNV
ncbi:MAG: hemolysin family protein [Candidatus Liptonbacteria bacterium]|nr:hemolysin family protein [Candidatus Liptonbacteria bacterium]